MNWILLILAGCLELVFTFCLGKINRVFGMEKYVWSFVLLVSLCVSMLLLIKVTKTLPVGTAYAIWTGIGAAGTVLIGIFFFKEPATDLLHYRVEIGITLIPDCILKNKVQL